MSQARKEMVGDSKNIDDPEIQQKHTIGLYDIAAYVALIEVQPSDETPSVAPIRLQIDNIVGSKPTADLKTQLKSLDIPKV